MGDHHHHQQYGLPDLRQLVTGRATHFQANPQSTIDNNPFFLPSRNLATPHHHHYYHHDSIIAPPPAGGAASEVMLPSGFVKLGNENYCTNATTSIHIPASTITTSTTTGSPAQAGTFGTFFGVEMESGWIFNDGGIIHNNNSRWPRQETLTLLDIRSRLDSRFKEANQKGPLWDEVSRIMAEEHGYQRSGKKCREKFENLYKYYKKTKDGKAGRQDGKHYRFFRQLEALYGEPSNQLAASASETSHHLVNNNSNFIYQESFQETNNNKHSDQSLSFSNTSEFETSSSENNGVDLSAIACMMNRSMEKRNKGLSNEIESQSDACTRANKKKNWKGKVKEFVDIQMKKLLERQEVWMERMLKSIEDREKERMLREEQWTKKEGARLNQIHEFWAKERAWIEARDVALMEVIKKCKGNGMELSSSLEEIAIATQSHYKGKAERWSEPEIFSLIQIRTTMESRFEETNNGRDYKYSKESLWEEIAGKMASLGYERGVEECKENWENMNSYFNMTTDHQEEEGNKKGKLEDLKNSNYFQQLDTYNGQETSLPTLNSYLGSSQIHGSYFHQGGGQLWSKYGLKLNKEKNQQL